MQFRYVAALSLLCTGLFFFEYLPPIRWVDIPYDLQGYHYSLDDFVFQSLKARRLPEWDPTMYCGMNFSSNPQTAMFYPPMWLVFLANISRAHLRYSTLEMLVLAHVWLAFLFCFLWLRHKRLHEMASLLGAAVFGFSGYLLLQLQHLGLVCGYVWLPMGLWGIDEATATGDWRPLWKLAGASALCFLSGYPPTFVVFCVCMLIYAAFVPKSWKVFPQVVAALALSLAIAMVQLLPALESAGEKVAVASYGSGIRRLDFYLSYIIPNYFDFSINTPIYTNPGGEYLYLGAPAFFGLLCLILDRRKLLGQLPLFAVGVVAFLFVNNPFDVVWNVIRHSNLLPQIVRSWYFLAGITLSVAGLAAAGIDTFLRREARPFPRWLSPLAIALLTAWSIRQIWMWIPGGGKFATGWRSGMDSLVMLALFSLSIFIMRSEKGARRIYLAAALLAAVGVDYKVFGTSRRVNAMRWNVDRVMASGLFPGMADATYLELRSHPEYRAALDISDPGPADLRHYGLTTPQGDDPLAPAQYLEGVIPSKNRQGSTPWSILLDPADEDLLQLLGVRYFITTDSQPLFGRLKANADYRAVPPVDSYFRVFEFSKAQPVYRWDGQARITGWSAKKRSFALHSAGGGQFVFIEQFLPGWRAVLDGKSVPIARWNRTFQAVEVPPGDHSLTFTFHSLALRVGAMISLVSTTALFFAVWWPLSMSPRELADRSMVRHAK